MEEGHTGLYMPKLHCELNGIERVWGQPNLTSTTMAKGDVQTKNVYASTYQVMGGIHCFYALLKESEMETEKVTTRKCEVYCIGLCQNAILDISDPSHR